MLPTYNLLQVFFSSVSGVTEEDEAGIDEDAVGGGDDDAVGDGGGEDAVGGGGGSDNASESSESCEYRYEVTALRRQSYAFTKGTRVTSSRDDSDEEGEEEGEEEEDAVELVSGHVTRVSKER